MSAAEQDKCKKFLATLVKEKGNRTCAECEARQPTWASTNLGVFFCLRCAGIHRQIGVHITKVKSISLDSWTWDQCKFMEAHGNAVQNACFEARMPPGRKINVDSIPLQVEEYLRDKYERKAWFKKVTPPRPQVHEEVPHAIISPALVSKQQQDHFDQFEANFSQMNFKTQPALASKPPTPTVEIDILGDFSRQTEVSSPSPSPAPEFQLAFSSFPPSQQTKTLPATNSTSQSSSLASTPVVSPTFPEDFFSSMNSFPVNSPNSQPQLSEPVKSKVSPKSLVDSLYKQEEDAKAQLQLQMKQQHDAQLQRAMASPYGYAQPYGAASMGYGQPPLGYGRSPLPYAQPPLGYGPPPLGYGPQNRPFLL